MGAMADRADADWEVFDEVEEVLLEREGAEVVTDDPVQALVLSERRSRMGGAFEGPKMVRPIDLRARRLPDDWQVLPGDVIERSNGERYTIDSASLQVWETTWQCECIKEI